MTAPLMALSVVAFLISPWLEPTRLRRVMRLALYWMFASAAFFAAENLLYFFSTTEDIVVHYGKGGTIPLRVDPAESPLTYLFLLATQLATVLGSLSLMVMLHRQP